LSKVDKLGHNQEWIEQKIGGEIANKPLDFLESLDLKLQTKLTRLKVEIEKRNKKADPVSEAIKKSAKKHQKK